MIGRPKRSLLTLVLASSLLAFGSNRAFADGAGTDEGAAGWVRYDKGIEIPVSGAESIEIVNRLGKISVTGWDRPAVAVAATKQAPTAELGERLRVQVSSLRGQRIAVRTYVRVRPAIPAPLSRALRRLMRRQATALGQLTRRRADDAVTRRELAAIRSELEQLGRRYAAAVAGGERGPVSDLAVPVADGQLDLRVQVPRHLQVKARTFDGRLVVRGCSGGVDASSEEGAVVVEQARGKVVTWTQKGTQRLVEIRGPVEVGGGEADVVLRRITGPVRAVLVAGTIDARRLGALVATLKTVRGTLRVDGVPRGGRYALASRDGDVIVRLGLGAARAFRLKGRARVFKPGGLKLRGLKREGDRLEGRWGQGGGLLEVTTQRGALKLISSPTE